MTSSNSQSLHKPNSRSYVINTRQNNGNNYFSNRRNSLSQSPFGRLNEVTDVSNIFSNVNNGVGSINQNFSNSNSAFGGNPFANFGNPRSEGSILTNGVNPFASISSTSSNSFTGASVGGVEGSVNPFAGGSNPFAGGSNPFAGGSNPFAGGSNPFASGSNPFAGGSNPFAGGSNPFAGGSNPFAGGSNPFTSASTSIGGVESAGNPFTEDNSFINSSIGDNSSSSNSNSLEQLPFVPLADTTDLNSVFANLSSRNSSNPVESLFSGGDNSSGNDGASFGFSLRRLIDNLVNTRVQQQLGENTQTNQVSNLGETLYSRIGESINNPLAVTLSSESNNSQNSAPDVSNNGFNPATSFGRGAPFTIADVLNTGENSTNQTKVTSVIPSDFPIGNNNVDFSNNNAIIGNFNSSLGDYSATIGNGNWNFNHYNTIVGNGNWLFGGNNKGIGNGNWFWEDSTNNSVVGNGNWNFGSYNIIIGNGNWVFTNSNLVIGNGNWLVNVNNNIKEVQNGVESGIKANLDQVFTSILGQIGNDFSALTGGLSTSQLETYNKLILNQNSNYSSSVPQPVPEYSSISGLLLLLVIVFIFSQNCFA